MKQLLIILFFSISAALYAQRPSVHLKIGNPSPVDQNRFSAKQDTLNWYRPESYGALGDGTTNDVAAFTAMVAAMPAHGGRVQLSSRQYSFHTTLTVNKPVHFYGNGSTHNDITPNFTSAIVAGAADIVLIRFVESHCSLKDLILKSSYANTAGAAVLIDSNFREPSSQITRFVLTDVNIHGFYNGVEATAACIFGITNGIIQVRNIGIKVANVKAPDSGDSFITGVYFVPNGATMFTGIYQSSSGGLRITNCKFNWNATSRFDYCYYAEISGTSDLIIAANSFENYKISAIRLKGVGNIFGNTSITGNQLSGLYPSTRPAITMENATNISITGNVITCQYFTGANDTAILLKDVSYTNIDNSYDIGFVRNVAYSGTATNLKGDAERGKMLPQVTSAIKATFTPRNSETIFCTDCTATDGSTGVIQTWSSSASAWKNHW